MRLVPVVLEEFRALAQSLEWRLSASYWRAAGVLPFATGEVPFIVNNSGRLSEDAAALLFHNCLESPPDDVLVVLELGAGTGLFARYFMDAFQAICRQEERDFYERVQYVVTDASPATVADWHRRAIFAPHEGRVTAAVADATAPGDVRTLDGETVRIVAVRAAFCNYVLDVLPASIVRAGAGGGEELCVRSQLVRAPEVIAQYGRAAVDELRRAADGGEPADRTGLTPLSTLLDVELAFRPASCAASLDLADGLRFAAGQCTTYNDGAVRALRALQRMLEPDGFILLNDYGPTDAADVAAHAVAQHFGHTLSVGINFPLLQQLFDRSPWRSIVPPGDAGRAVHARLLLHDRLALTREAFENRFSADAQQFFESPCEQAREHAAAGRNGDALECYRLALTRSPRDWRTVAEAAEYVGLQLRDHPAGVELARAALELNPWYSSWCWNVMGDCLFCLERFEHAHEAYLQALSISAHDARTHLNLAYTFAERGDLPRALQAVADGLASDRPALYHERLLEKQQQILALARARYGGEQARFRERAIRFLAAVGAEATPPVATDVTAPVPTSASSHPQPRSRP